MKSFILGSVMALLLLGGPVAAECLYYGVAYSEGARVCMHRTMYMCQGERWVKTAERCWERYSRGPGTRCTAYNFSPAELAFIQHTNNLTEPEQEKLETQRR